MIGEQAIPRALIVEDEREIRRFVRAALEDEGCTVFESQTLRQGLVEAGARRPDLIVLDLGLPDGDGVDYIRQLRVWCATPVIVLSARSQEEDKIAALDAGADDYLTKPFGVGELKARARALLRRQVRPGEGDGPEYRFGGVHVDLARRVVTRDGEAVHLTPIEYHLLGVLLTHHGRVMTQRHLLREVWGTGSVSNGHYLRVYIGHLRRKLEQDPAQPQFLLTETGVGYRLQI